MDATSSGPFITLQPRPVSGWPLRLLCDLDATAPNFLGHVLTASELKRQCIFAAVAEFEQNISSTASAVERASNTDCREPPAQTAHSLVLLKPLQIIRAIYGHVPDGLIGTLKRVGPDAFNRPTLYRDLFRLFAEPERRERADLVRQSPGILTEERLEVALALDSALLHQRAFERVCDLHEAEEANAAVRLIRATVSTASTDELLRSLSVLPKNISLTVWASVWLKKMDQPLASDRIRDDASLKVLKASELGSASLQLRNCLRERVLHVASGRACYVVTTEEPKVIAELLRTGDGGWVLFEMWGPGNERPDERSADELRGKLEAAGVISLAPTVDQADLVLLAEFFSAFDLTGGWPLPRRGRHRLQATQEAA